MGTLLWLAVVYAVFGVCVQESTWGVWMNITQCNAMPCGCYNKTETCTSSKHDGEVIQMRVCYIDGLTGSCKPDNDGFAMREIGCRNNKICPGWSEWIPKECNCGKKQRKIERLCNSPPPLHRDVLCTRLDNGKGTTDTKIENCTCEDSGDAESFTGESVTIEENTEAMTTPLPCCVVNNEYDPNAEEEPEPEYQYYYDDACNKNCTVNSTTTVGFDVTGFDVTTGLPTDDDNGGGEEENEN